MGYRLRSIARTSSASVHGVRVRVSSAASIVHSRTYRGGTNALAPAAAPFLRCNAACCVETRRAALQRGVLRWTLLRTKPSLQRNVHRTGPSRDLRPRRRKRAVRAGACVFVCLPGARICVRVPARCERRRMRACIARACVSVRACLGVRVCACVRVFVCV